MEAHLKSDLSLARNALSRSNHPTAVAFPNPISTLLQLQYRRSTCPTSSAGARVSLAHICPHNLTGEGRRVKTAL